MRKIALDQLARGQALTQPRQGGLPLDGRTQEFAVVVLVQLKVEVPLRETAKSHHLAWFNNLGEHHIRRWRSTAAD